MPIEFGSNIMSKDTHVEFSAAEKQRDKLIAETGVHHVISQDTNGQFVCKKVEEGTDEKEKASEQPASKQSEALQSVRLQPSNKIVFSYAFPLLIGLGLFALSEEFTVSIVKLINNEGMLSHVRSINGGFEVVGSVIFFSYLLKFLHRVYSKTYIIDEKGLRLLEGIIGKDIKVINYKDIQTPTLKRSLTDRLLNTGTLEFSAAGTSTIDMYFDTIDNPHEVLELIIKNSNL